MNPILAVSLEVERDVYTGVCMGLVVVGRTLQFSIRLSGFPCRAVDSNPLLGLFRWKAAFPHS